MALRLVIDSSCALSFRAGNDWSSLFKFLRRDFSNALRIPRADTWAGKCHSVRAKMHKCKTLQFETGKRKILWRCVWSSRTCYHRALTFRAGNDCSSLFKFLRRDFSNAFVYPGLTPWAAGMTPFQGEMHKGDELPQLPTWRPAETRWFLT